MVISYVILGVSLAIFLAIFILFMTYGKKITYPKGHRFTSTYEGYTATVILDELGTVGLGEDLAHACAVTMWATTLCVQKYGPTSLQSVKLRECVFVFYSDKEYNKLEKDAGLKQGASNGFSWDLTTNLAYRNRTYRAVFARNKFINEVLISGQIAVHEYIHCMSRSVTRGGWDREHKIWDEIVHDGKNVDTLAKELVAQILANKGPALVNHD